LIDGLLHGNAVHIDQARLLLSGVIAAVLTVAGLILVALILMRRSSRTHRALVEAPLITMLLLPVFGVQIGSDINRALNRDSVTVQASVERRWETEDRNSGHYIEVSAPTSPLVLPETLRVSADVFRSVQAGTTVPIVIGRGSLGVPWLRSINGVPVR
jgi:hypothetical protein